MTTLFTSFVVVWGFNSTTTVLGLVQIAYVEVLDTLFFMFIGKSISTTTKKDKAENIYNEKQLSLRIRIRFL